MNGQFFVNVFNEVITSGIVKGIRNTTISVRSTSGQINYSKAVISSQKSEISQSFERRYMFKLSEMFGQRGGSDAFGRRAVKNIGIRTDIGQTFAKTGTTNTNQPSTRDNRPPASVRVAVAHGHAHCPAHCRMARTLPPPPHPLPFWSADARRQPSLWWLRLGLLSR